MSCCGQREKLVEVRAEQKWDYINLSDFKSTSCLTPLSYGILYISLGISIACYAVDLFTAANLLFFNRWSGQVKPAIPFNVSRWIFAVCIVLSWILLVYRWVRAVRAMRSGIVAASYLDPLAVMLQSIRVGKTGRGWKRFLVFAELTKGRKGAEYVALFTYFSFEAWLRIIFAEGPRQVINALTLYSVMEANLVPVGEHAASRGHTPIVQFFVNIKILADHNKQQAAVLFGMLFTLVIWVIALLSLAIAALSYITFLWHHIPRVDNGLSGYCRRKVDRRLQKIVGVKVNKALAKGNKSRARDQPKAIKAAGIPAQAVRQPTLPLIDSKDDDKNFQVPLSRQTTRSTLPPYPTSQPSRNNSYFNSAKGAKPKIPDTFPLPSRPILPSRSTTQSSAHSDASYTSNAPLIGQAAQMGYGIPPRSSSPASPMRTHYDYDTMNEHLIQANGSVERPIKTPQPHNTLVTGRPIPDPLSIRFPPQNYNVKDSIAVSIPEQHSPTQFHEISPGLHEPPSDSSQRRTPEIRGTRQTPVQEYEMWSQRHNGGHNETSSSGGYVAFNPMRHAQREPPKDISQGPPVPSVRNFTLPFRAAQTINRSTEQAQQPTPPVRSETAPVQGSSSSAPPPTRVDGALSAHSRLYNGRAPNSYHSNSHQAPSRGVLPPRAATTSPWRNQIR